MSFGVPTWSCWCTPGMAVDDATGLAELVCVRVAGACGVVLRFDGDKRNMFHGRNWIRDTLTRRRPDRKADPLTVRPKRVI